MPSVTLEQLAAVLQRTYQEASGLRHDMAWSAWLEVARQAAHVLGVGLAPAWVRVDWSDAEGCVTLTADAEVVAWPTDGRRLVVHLNGYRLVFDPVPPPGVEIQPLVTRS